MGSPEVITAVFCESAIESAQQDQFTLVQSILADKENHLEKARWMWWNNYNRKNGKNTACFLSRGTWVVCALGGNVCDGFDYFPDAGRIHQFGRSDSDAVVSCFFCMWPVNANYEQMWHGDEQSHIAKKWPKTTVISLIMKILYANSDVCVLVKLKTAGFCIQDNCISPSCWALCLS